MSIKEQAIKRSAAVRAALAKLEKNKDNAKVNLPAIARRDEKFMKCWKPLPGYVFVSSDFTSLEPSITAEYSKDFYYRYATYEGVGKKPYYNDLGILMIDDIYLMVASQLPNSATDIRMYFSKPENALQWVKDSEVCKNHPLIKKHRKFAKPACLGFGYGMGPRKFVKSSYDAGITVSLDDAKKMYKAYWNLFADLRQFSKKLSQLLERDKYLINAFGYRLTTESHKAYNAFIQSSASGVLDLLILKFFSVCTDALFVAPIHDEVIYQIPIDKVEEAKRIQDECVKSLNEDLGFDVPMRLGFVVGESFADIK